MSVVIRIKNVRLSFPDLFVPRRYMDDPTKPLKYKAHFLVPHGSPQEKEIKTAINTVNKEQWGDRKKLYPVNASLCFRNGNDTEYDGYENHGYLVASNEYRPAIFDQYKKPLDDNDGTIYAGCYVHAVVRVWAQTGHGARKVNAELRGVMYHREGVAFAGSGKINIAEFAEFDDIEIPPIPETPPTEFDGVDAPSTEFDDGSVPSWA